MKNTFVDRILMVRPANFGYNQETAEDNAFQNEGAKGEEANITKKAIEEFDEMVRMLRQADIEVLVWQDTETPVKPDAVFPNNWFSTTPSGMLITYPMYAENRRPERSEDIIEWLLEQVDVKRRYAMEHYEAEQKYLESTGSILFDHDYKVMFACLSERTNLELLQKLGVLLGYKVVWFEAVDKTGLPIYHTNVMMCLAEGIAIVCLDSLPDEGQREALVEAIISTDREVLPISYRQLHRFAGNMIQLYSQDGEPRLILSAQALDSLTKRQVQQLKNRTDLVVPDIETIETYGGGSVRCMIAELFV